MLANTGQSDRTIIKPLLEAGSHGEEGTKIKRWSWKKVYLDMVEAEKQVLFSFTLTFWFPPQTITFRVMLFLSFFFLWLMKLESPDSNLAEFWCTHSHLHGIRQCIKLQKYTTYHWRMYQTIWPRKERIYHKNDYDWSLEEQKTKVLLLYSIYTVFQIIYVPY